jgi:hypothetical protein
MSNKTIFKRIALVAVAALGAGLLTVTPATAADNAAVGSNNATEATGILNVATKASTTGDAVTDADPANLTSLGLLAATTTLGVSSLSSTATMRADGEIVFYTQVAAGTSTDSFITFVVEGGVIDEQAGDLSAANEVLLSAGRDVMVVGDDDEAAVFQHSIGVKPNSGVTSFTVSLYSNNLTAAQDTAGSMADVLVTTLAGTTSKGSLIQRYTVTVAATSASGIYSSAYSYVQGVAAATTAASSNVDEASSLTIANSASSVAYIAIKLQDAYDVTLDNLGAISVTGTGGAGIYYAGSSAAGTPTNTSAVSNDASGTITVARPAALANKAFTTTVTITYNGAVVGTKTVKFQGEVAKMNIVQYKNIAAVGATSTYQGQIEYLDNAGNVLLPTSGTSVKSSTLNAFVTAASIGDWADAADPVSYYDVTCSGTDGANGGADAGSADLVFRHTNPFSGSIIETSAVKVTCAGDPVTYTASLDKATYAPGDIATLTITGKDSAGNLANGEQNFQSTTSGSEFFITAPQLTPVTAVSTTSVKFSSGAGIKTYKFTVGNTEGSYNMIVGAPTINALLLGGANQTVSYKVVAPATGAVSNAEVLAAIVKLIASINKQIRALQKSLRR